jgi:hypothetical protein
MGRRKDRWAPPGRGEPPPTEPVESIDLYPNPLPPPRPPATRATILADLQVGFAALTEDELRVARLWIFGRSLEDVCYFLDLEEKTAKRLYRSVRRKLRETLMRGAPRPGAAALPQTQQEPERAGAAAPPTPAQPVLPEPAPRSETTQEPGDTTPA